ncbi:MAG: hypothetical protein ACKVPJ_11490 [Chitinophagales bacterium]
MKVFTLINALQPAEKKEVSAVIKSAGRKSLESIFIFLEKSAAKKKYPSKEELFSIAYKEGFSIKKDYLLRNELRLLTDIICSYMAEKEALKSLRGNTSVQHAFLLRSWNDRKLTDLFHKNAEKWIHEAMEERYLNEAFEMYLLALNRVMYDFEDSPEKFEQLVSLVNGCTKCVEQLFVYKWWSVESHHQAIHNYKNVAAGKNIPVKPRKPDAHAFQSFKDDDFVLAMQYENSIYAASKDTYLSILKNAYRHCKNVMGKTGRGIFNSSNVNPIKFYSVLNERLMIIFCSEGNVNEAAEYVQELEKLIYEKKVRFNYTLNYNIAYYYYFAGQYKKVIDRADNLLSELKQNKRLYYQALGMKAYSHIFLKQFDLVRDCIPQEVQKINLDEYVQFRMAEMILWYVDGTYDAALRENENIRRMLKGKTDEERKQTVIDFKKLNNIYKVFFEAVSSVGKERKNKLQKSKQEIEGFRNKYPVVFRHTPALNWLFTEIQEAGL